MPDLPASIYQHWVHAHEDDTPETQAYRPASYPFPPARGRSGFEIRDDGSFIEHGIAPTDGIQQTEGRWRAEAGDRIQITMGGQGERRYALDIVSCEPDLLRIVR